MKSLLIHGCYDPVTLETLKNLGIKEFSFDLRGRSPNLIPFKDLRNFVGNTNAEKIFLTFENDQKETIESSLDLLKASSAMLILRDKQTLEFYQSLSSPFYWVFNPEADWKNILALSWTQGVLLPLKWQGFYQKNPELWEIIEKRNSDVYLHAESFEETVFLNHSHEFKLSIDLTQEVESSYRMIDQDKLKRMKIWRRLNENSVGQ